MENYFENSLSATSCLSFVFKHLYWRDATLELFFRLIALNYVSLFINFHLIAARVLCTRIQQASSLSSVRDILFLKDTVNQKSKDSSAK